MGHRCRSTIRSDSPDPYQPAPPGIRPASLRRGPTVISPPVGGYSNGAVGGGDCSRGTPHSMAGAGLRRPRWLSMKRPGDRATRKSCLNQGGAIRARKIPNHGPAIRAGSVGRVSCTVDPGGLRNGAEVADQGPKEHRSTRDADPRLNDLRRGGGEKTVPSRPRLPPTEFVRVPGESAGSFSPSRILTDAYGGRPRSGLRPSDGQNPKEGERPDRGTSRGTPRWDGQTFEVRVRITTTSSSSPHSSGCSPGHGFFFTQIEAEAAVPVPE